MEGRMSFFSHSSCVKSSCSDTRCRVQSAKKFSDAFCTLQGANSVPLVFKSELEPQRSVYSLFRIHLLSAKINHVYGCCILPET